VGFGYRLHRSELNKIKITLKRNFKFNSTIKTNCVDVSFDSDVLERLNVSILQSKRFGRNTAVFNNSTCCIIKPHLVSAGMAGAAIYEIQKAGFDISAILSVNLTKPNAEEFLEVYKGVVQEYPVCSKFSCWSIFKTEL
jgi:hypothetical protein